MTTPLPLPRNYADAKNDLLHGIWNQLSLINGKPVVSLATRTARSGYSNSTEDILFQIHEELNDLASPMRNRIQGTINPRDFGGVGDGVADDTAAIQAALDYASSANNPQQYITGSPARGAGNNVFIPHGNWKVTDELKVKGSLAIFMEQANSYGGTRIVQTTSGKHLFHIVADTDGSSSGVSFIGGILKAGTAQNNPDVALIYGGDAVGDGNNNSTYIRNVTFGTPESYAIRIKRGDDVKILDCTFDVSGTKSIGLGGAGSSEVTNYTIHRCTFYDIRAGVIDLINAPYGQIKDNSVNFDDAHRIPYFISAVNAVSVNNLQVKGNTLDGVDLLWSSNIPLDNVAIEGNTVTNAKGQTIAMGGGGIVYRVQLINNTLDGDFSGLISGQEKSPIFLYGTGIRSSIITGNILYNRTGTLSKPITFDVTRCELTRCLNNVVLGYSTYTDLVMGYGYGTAAPTQNAAFVGQEFLNTTTSTWYKSTAIGSGLSDWKAL